MPATKLIHFFKKLTATALLLSFSTSSHALFINFDYKYDTSGFFSDSSRKNALESAASIFASFTDSLTAIDSSGSNNFTARFYNPATGQYDGSVPSFDVAANTLTIFAGARNLGTSVVGEAGPGGYGCSGTISFCSDAISRGQGTTEGVNTATDFAPWGGSIAFDSDTSWYFGEDVSGLTSSLVDFKSVAIHELGHVFGFGTSASFKHLLPNLSSGHFAEGTQGLVYGVTQEVAMDPSINVGQRKLLTDVDLAAFRTIGWNVPVTAVPEPSSYLMMFAGLTLLLARKKLFSWR